MTLERIIETMLIDRLSECCFWDGEEWTVDDMATEKLAREIMEAFHRSAAGSLAKIEKLARENNHPGVNVGAHSLASKILKVLYPETQPKGATDPCP